MFDSSHHQYKYAVEQIMLILFPGQRPDYSPLPPGRIGGVLSVGLRHLGHRRQGLHWKGRSAVGDLPGAPPPLTS